MPEVCEENQHYPDISDCEYFFLCNRGELVHQKCEAPKHQCQIIGVACAFDINSLECVHPGPSFDCDYRCLTTLAYKSTVISTEVIATKIITTENIITTDGLSMENTSTTDKITTEDVITTDPITTDVIFTTEQITTEDGITTEMIITEDIITAESITTEEIFTTERITTVDVATNEWITTEKGIDGITTKSVTTVTVLPTTTTPGKFLVILSIEYSVEIFKNCMLGCDPISTHQGRYTIVYNTLE